MPDRNANIILTLTNNVSANVRAANVDVLSLASSLQIAKVAIQEVQQAFEFAKAGENVNRVERSFDSLAKQAHTTGDTILDALHKASGGEVSDLNLQLATNKGLLLGVANSADQFASLMEIARDRAAKMGITTTQAFDNIATGIGRESPRILDNLGIIVDAKKAHEEYARGIGKSASELTKAERIEALRNAVIAQGKSGLDANLTAINNQTNSFAQLSVALENATNRQAAFAAEVLKTPAQNLTNSLNRDDQIQAKKSDLGASAAEGAENFTQYQNAIKQADRELLHTFGTARGFKIEVDQLSEAQFNYAKSLQAQGAPANDAIQKAQGLKETFDALAGAQQHIIGAGVGGAQPFADLNKRMVELAAASPSAKVGIEALADAYSHNRLTTDQYVNALNGLELQYARNTVVAQEEEREQRRLSGAYFATSDAARQEAGALATTIQKSQDSALQSNKVADAQQRIASLGKDVFAGLLTSADGARILEQQYGFTAAEAEKLIAAQTRLAGIANVGKAEVAATGFRQNEINGEFQTQDQLNQSIQEQIGIDKARQEQILRTGTEAQKIAVLQQQYNDAVRQSGAGSEAAINAQTALIAEQQNAIKDRNSGLDRGLKLQESTYDSIEKQRQAVIDLAVAEARNRLDTLKDQDELKKANAILNSSGASANLKARAQAKKDLILAEENKRDFEIGQQQATAGGKIINGKLYQSVGGPVQVGTPTPVGAGPQQVQAPAPPQGSGGKPLVITMDGKEVATIILPYAWAELDGAIQHARITQGA